MAIQFLQDVRFGGEVRDSSGDAGTPGQILSSTATGTNWITLTDLQGVTSVSAGNGMNFTTITGTGPVTMGTPGTLTSATTNGVTATSHTHSITTGISNTNIVKINSTTVATGEYARFTTTGLESRSVAEVAADIGAITEVTAGTGMTGGGSSGAVTLNVIGGTGITANADDVAITYVGTGNAILAATDSSGTPLATGAKIWFSDDGTIAQANVSDLPFTNNTGDITEVTAGTNLNGGGTSGGVTINLDNDISLNTVEYTYPTSNSQFYGEIVTFGAFEAPGFAAGELICLGNALGNPTWRKANNTIATESTGMLGIALGSSPSAGILVRGFARSTAYNGFSDGGKCYISATDGDMTTTAPTATNAYLRIVGYVVDSITGAAEIYFCPDNTYVQIA